MALARIGFDQVFMAVFRRRERMMRRRPALVVFVVFEHREIDHPQRTPVVVEQTVLLAEIAVADLHAQRADRIVDDLGLVGAEENQVAVLGAGLLDDFCQRVVMQVFDDRRLQAVAALGFFVDLDIRQALGAVDRDELGIGVDLGTRHRAAARNAQADHAAAFHVGRAGEHLEFDILHDSVRSVNASLTRMSGLSEPYRCPSL